MKLNISSILLILLLLFISCKEESEFDIPTVFTGEVINADQTKATFTAKISNPGNIPIVESGFIWGVHSHDNNDIKLTNTTGENEFSLLTNYKLLPGKTFYTRAFVKTNSNTIYGREVSFNTEVAPLELGMWSKIMDNLYGNNDYIRTGFTLNDFTYLIIEFGDIYGYNHTTNEINFVMSDTNIGLCDFSCVFQNQAYIFSKNAFYRFDVQTTEFKKLKEWDTEIMYGCSGFIINDDIYVGLGSDGFNDYSKEFWKYNISSDNWIRIEDFPGDYRLNAFSFSINGIGYMGGGFNLIQGRGAYPKFTDLWSYDPEMNKWQPKENLPISKRDNLWLPGTTISEFGYCFFENALYEYNPTFNLWEEMKYLSAASKFYSPYMFSYKNKVFIVESFYYYNEPNTFKIWMYGK